MTPAWAEQALASDRRASERAGVRKRTAGSVPVEQAANAFADHGLRIDRMLRAAVGASRGTDPVAVVDGALAWVNDSRWPDAQKKLLRDAWRAARAPGEDDGEEIAPVSTVLGFAAWLRDVRAKVRAGETTGKTKKESP